MNEWWTEQFKLLIKFKLNKKDIEKAVMSKRLRLRDGANEFFDYLYSRDIPLIILSSSGLGEESISIFLEKRGKLHKNIYIISNSFEWDEKGYAIGVKKPIIHVMNKDETSLKKFNFYEKIKNRKNAVLLGDSPGDVGMANGFNHDNLIKIGFLNEDIEKNLEQYKINYDIVILNDSDMSYVNGLIREILG